MAAIKIGLLGATGRMGKMIMKEVLQDTNFCLVGGSVRPESAEKGKDLGILANGHPINISASSDLETLFKLSDIIIDFTKVECLPNHLYFAETFQKPFINGVTGFEEDQLQKLKKASNHIPILYAPNMCLGINLLMSIVEHVSSILDESYDIEIFETHHHHKIDAPSGSALALGKAAAKGRNVDFQEKAILGWINHPKREKGEIGFSVQRAGDVVGEHTVSFFGPSERIDFVHKATNRQVFARGALKAAQWLFHQKPGLYSMKDVLSLSL